MLPVRCSRDTFFTSSLRKNIVAFRLVGYPVWIGEAAGSNPVYYTKSSSLKGKAAEKVMTKP